MGKDVAKKYPADPEHWLLKDIFCLQILFHTG
jgi:hypothetical protein